MSDSYLSNERIYLRALEPEDIDFFYRMENNPSLWEVSDFTVPYSAHILKEFIFNSRNDLYADRQIRLVIVRRSDDRAIGAIDVADFSPFHERGSVGIAILEEFRKEKYASDALSLLCDYVFGFLGIKQLYAHIPVDNEASIRLFASCGFERCGVLKSWLRAGNVYKDAVIVQRVNG